ncbi:MAG: hypothetical protein CMJ81_03015 [Planctomycetaceae bacterium]|nr:hypothetical protein [Planctomycetaceae bacterium]
MIESKHRGEEPTDLGVELGRRDEVWFVTPGISTGRSTGSGRVEVEKRGEILFVERCLTSKIPPHVHRWYRRNHGARR